MKNNNQTNTANIYDEDVRIDGYLTFTDFAIRSQPTLNGGLLTSPIISFKITKDGFLFNGMEFSEIYSTSGEKLVHSEYVKQFTSPRDKLKPFQEKFNELMSKGQKELQGKLNYELDWYFLEGMAERMKQHKGKYEPYNWQKPMEVESLKQALLRHTLEVMKDEYSDDGRDLGHLEAIALNAMFIYWQKRNNPDL